MPEIGKASIGVLFDKTQIGKDLAESLTAAEGEAKGAGALLGHTVGLGMVAGIGTAVAVGGAFLEIGEQFDKAFHTIEQRTGAADGALKGLDQSFKDVFASAPGANFSNVADAVSELYVRTGLTGSALDDFARKEIELGKITKTDVGQNIDTTTALFKQFGIAAADQSTKLDVLFKASQVSGKSIADIGSAMESVAPMAQVLGLSFEQTAALTANLTELGLPATKVMMGLGSEFAKAAKAGEDPLAVIGKLVEEIKKAPDATTAATLATKDFGIGARQAATLVDGLRSGALDLGDTMAKISGSGGGIDATTQATLSLGDKFDLLKNKALVALEPISEKVVDLVNSFVDKIPGALSTVGDVLSTVGDAFRELFGAEGVEGFGAAIDSLLPAGVSFEGQFQRVGAVILGVWHTMQTVGDYIDAHLKQTLIGVGVVAAAAFTAWAVSAAAAAVSTLIAAAPVIAIGVAIAGLAAGLIYAYTHFDAFRRIVDDVPPALIAVRDAVQTAFEWIDTNVVPIVEKFVGFLVEQVDHLAAWWSQHWDSIHDAVRNVMIAVGVFIEAGVAQIMFVWNHFGDQIMAVTSFVWGGIQNLIDTTVRIIGDMIALAVDLLSGHWGKAWDDVKDILAAAVGFITTSIGNLGTFAVDFFSSLPGNIIGALGDIAGKLGAVGLAAANGFWDALKATFANVIDWFKGLPGRILSAIGDLGSLLLDVGASLATGFLKGIQNAFGLGDTLQSQVDAVNKFKAEHPNGAAPGSGVAAGGQVQSGSYALGGWIKAASLDQPVDITGHGGEYMLSRDMLAGRQQIDPAVHALISGLSGGSSQPVRGRGIELHGDINVYNPAPETAASSVGTELQIMADQLALVG